MPARLLGAAMRHVDIPNLGLVIGEQTDIRRTLGTFGPSGWQRNHDRRAP
jgi:hypothetical protein